MAKLRWFNKFVAAAAMVSVATNIFRSKSASNLSLLPPSSSSAKPRNMSLRSYDESTLLMEFLSPAAGTPSARRQPQPVNGSDTAARKKRRKMPGNVTWTGYEETVFHNDDDDDGLPDPEESFAACLILKDDNHRLPEWLGTSTAVLLSAYLILFAASVVWPNMRVPLAAYHYFAMPLRYLVVAVDPNSKTSPRQIFEKWGDWMTIVEWMPTDRRLFTDPSFRPARNIDAYRKFQIGFYQQCTKHMIQKKRKWTAYFDIDEFFTINSNFVKKSRTLFSKPGSILRLTNELSSTHPRHGSLQIKNVSKAGLRRNTWYVRFKKHACITLPRVLISAKESSEEEVSAGAPSFVDARNFDTLRWRYGSKNQTGKSIVDLSRVAESNKSLLVHNSHLPVKGHCKMLYFKPKSIQALPIRLHHYLGSWESYSCREDARENTAANRSVFAHSYEKWEAGALVHQGVPDDQVRPWIKGFVQMVGNEAAKTLLEGAGDLSQCKGSARPDIEEWEADEEGDEDIVSSQTEAEEEEEEEGGNNAIAGSDASGTSNLLVKRTDQVYRNSRVSPVVLEPYKLLFFSVPKVASTMFKLLFHEMLGIDKKYLGKPKSRFVWKELHNPNVNRLPYLKKYNISYANHMMFDEKEWTRAIFVRNPHERLLSAYLDKGVGTNFTEVRRICCPRKRACMPPEADSFEDFVTLLERSCLQRDKHWAPQISRIRSDYWAHVNFVGYMESFQEDLERLLRKVNATASDLPSLSSVLDDPHDGGGDAAAAGNDASRRHATDSRRKMKKFYTSKKLFDRVTKMYRTDYDNPHVNFRPPTEIFDSVDDVDATKTERN